MDTNTRYEAHERVERDVREHGGDSDHQGSFRRTRKAVVNAVEYGSGWYHEAAIEEAKAPSRAA